MEITFPSLDSLNVAVSLAYNTQFFSVGRRCDPFTYDATSTGSEEVYPRLDLIGGLREWLGDRQVEQLSLSSFTLKNKWFEKTISIGRDNIEDDKFGLLTPAAMQLGENAAQMKDLLIASLMKNGHTAPTYDGQNFFDVAHPNPNADGSAGTVANYIAGAGAPWFMFDVARVIKPLIWQTRKPFQIIPKFSMTDEQVFWNKEFEWGVDGRCNAGYGLWQLGAMSMAAPTAANIVTMRTNMASIRRPNGAPMGLRGSLIVAPTSLYPILRQYAENEFLPPGDPGIVSGQPTVNTVRGLFTVLENEWLN